MDVDSTYRRHSAQDTGTRPGLRRCLGGGSLPEGELEPCTALSGRVERTAEGRRGEVRVLGAGSLKGTHTSPPKKRIIELLGGPLHKTARPEVEGERKGESDIRDAVQQLKRSASFITLAGTSWSWTCEKCRAE